MKKAGLIIISIILCVILAACGKRDYTGYYIYDSGDSDKQSNIAMQIYKDGTVIYMQSCNKDENDYKWAQSHTGTIEPDKDAGMIYFSTCHEAGDEENQPSTMAKYSPTKFELSDNKKRAYLSAESDEFYTITFDVVSEKDFNKFVNETSVQESKLFNLWNGETFMEWEEFWNQNPEAKKIYSATVMEAPAAEEESYYSESAPVADDWAEAPAAEQDKEWYDSPIDNENNTEMNETSIIDNIEKKHVYHLGDIVPLSVENTYTVGPNYVQNNIIRNGYITIRFTDFIESSCDREQRGEESHDVYDLYYEIENISFYDSTNKTDKLNFESYYHFLNAFSQGDTCVNIYQAFEDRNTTLGVFDLAPGEKASGVVHLSVWEDYERKMYMTCLGKHGDFRVIGETVNNESPRIELEW